MQQQGDQQQDHSNQNMDSRAKRAKQILIAKTRWLQKTIANALMTLSAMNLLLQGNDINVGYR